MSPKRVVTFGLFEFSLAVVAVVAGLAQQFDFLLPFEVWDWRAWREQLAAPGQWLAGLGFLAQVLGVVVAIGSLALVGVATGVIRTVLREWNFRLERTDKGLRRRRGLLTRTDLVMPVHRVQALRLRTGFLRRLFGWHALKVVSLASDSGSANHEAVPFAQMDEIAPVVAETGFALPATDLDWDRAMPAYRVDGFLLGFAVALADFGRRAGFRSLGLTLIPLLGGAGWRCMNISTGDGAATRSTATSFTPAGVARTQPDDRQPAQAAIGRNYPQPAGAITRLCRPPFRARRRKFADAGTSTGARSSHSRCRARQHGRERLFRSCRNERVAAGGALGAQIRPFGVAIELCRDVGTARNDREILAARICYQRRDQLGCDTLTAHAGRGPACVPHRGRRHAIPR